MSSIKYLLKKIETVVFPYTCILCQIRSDQEIDLCTPCQNRLPFLSYNCEQCGEQLHGKSLIMRCGVCLSNSPPYDRTIALFQYKDPILHLINQIKYYGKSMYGRVLSELFLKKIQTVYTTTLPEFIIPVPLHKKRIKERGYNQSIVLAKPIAKKLAIPFSINSCQKIKHTPTQSSLTALKRKKNLKNAFAINPSFRAKHIALFDDVMTTGNTFAKLSLAFKKHGVSVIDVWCIARTLKK